MVGCRIEVPLVVNVHVLRENIFIVLRGREHVLDSCLAYSCRLYSRLSFINLFKAYASVRSLLVVMITSTKERVFAVYSPIEFRAIFSSSSHGDSQQNYDS